MSRFTKINGSIKVDDINSIFKSINWNTRAEEKWNEIIKKTDFYVQVLDDEKLVGFGRIVDDGFSCMIYDVVVHSDYQKQGIGNKVMNELLVYIRKQNFKYTNLFYHEENKGLDKFYRKLGFYSVKNGMRLKMDNK